MKFRAVVLASAAAAFALLASAQKPPASTTPPTTRTPTNPNNTPTTNSTQPNNGLSNNPQRDIYLSGRVQMDDGNPVPMETTIEKLCASRRQPLGYVDSKGTFSVTMKSDPTATDSEADYQGRAVSSGNGLSSGNTNSSYSNGLAGCEVRAVLAGYRSDVVDLTSRRSLDNPDVGTIVLHRLGGTQGGGTVSASMLNAPKGAIKNYQRGMDELHKSNFGTAQKFFEKAVTEYPTFATAWFELGRLAMPSDKDLGRNDFKTAIAADPKFLPPYRELALMWIREKNWPETVSITDRALKLDSAGFPELFYLNAVAHFNLRQINEAETRVREAIKSDPDKRLPHAQLLLGYVLLEKGDLRGAAEQMKAFLALVPSGNDADKTKSQVARLEEKINAQDHRTDDHHTEDQ
jgi:tetratricopeptide (TPR) repeat protein